MLSKLIELYPLLAAFVFAVSCLATGAGIALMLPSSGGLGGQPGRIEARLSAIEQRLNAIEASRQAPSGPTAPTSR
jgi:hypothetical protein